MPTATANPTVAHADTGRDAVIHGARVSLVRIALAFGLADAGVPFLLLLIGGGDRTELLFGFGWTFGWALAVIYARVLLDLLDRLPTRLLLAIMAGAATVLTVSATGGLDSPLKTGGNWLGWATTVVASARASLAVAAICSTALTTAFVVSGATWSQLAEGPDRYIVVTGILNPFAVVLVALALAGVFRSVIAGTPGSLWSIRAGGPATTPAMTALFRGDPIALPAAARGPAGVDGPIDGDRADDPDAGELLPAVPPARPVPAVPLTAREREIVDLLAQGLAPKQIAHAAGRSVDTVYEQIRSAKRKVDARTTDQLVVLVLAAGPGA